jgi:hypothetical protein
MQELRHRLHKLQHLWLHFLQKYGSVYQGERHLRVMLSKLRDLFNCDYLPQMQKREYSLR